jgi:hypothetical protein
MKHPDDIAKLTPSELIDLLIAVSDALHIIEAHASSTVMSTDITRRNLRDRAVSSMHSALAHLDSTLANVSLFHAYGAAADRRVDAANQQAPYLPPFNII